MTGPDLEALADFIQQQCPARGRPHFLLPLPPHDPNGKPVAPTPTECMFDKAAAVIREAARPAAGERVPNGVLAPSESERRAGVADPFSVAICRVPAQHLQIRLLDGDFLAGSLELAVLENGLLMLCAEWRRPEKLGDDTPWDPEAVRERLIVEAIRLADERGASLGMGLPGFLLDRRLKAHGFVPAGDLWYRAAAS